MAADEHNVHPYRRERLEPEIAAMSVEILDEDDDDNRTVIVNIDDPGAKAAIKKVIILVGAAFGGLAEWVRSTAREQPAVTALIGAGMSAAATAMLITITDNSDPRPPVVAERVVTVPALPHTRTVTARSTIAPSPPPKEKKEEGTRRSETAAQPSAWRTVAPQPEPTVQPSTQPTRERTRRPEPTPRTSASRTPTSQEATVQPTRDSNDTEPATAANPATSAAPGRAPTQQPIPEAEPPPNHLTPAAAECGGPIRVDVDPLLDLCLLG